jgi:hypothetical protein
MTVEIPVPEGPPCDFCPDWPAVGSLMNLSDYTTQKFCASCGASFLLGIAQAMAGVPAAGSEPDPAHAAGQTATAADSGSESVTAGAPDDDDEPGSRADHWASTTHVRRSTHGHRKPPGTRPAADDPPGGA